MARPISTSYSDEQREAIISHVLAELSGGRSIARILREDDGMPAQSQFWRWHFESVELQEKVARARENGVECLMDEALDIADTPQIGEVITEDDDKRTVRTEDMLGHRKLRIEVRHKYAQMIAPRKYGPKLDLTSGGDKLGLTAELEAARRRAAQA